MRSPIQVICNYDEQTPTAYRNVYDEGDEWVKIRGCDQCPVVTRLHCCGNHDYENHISCKLQNLITGECSLQMPPNMSKPWYCIRSPAPNTTRNFAKLPCVLEYKCVKGPKIGKIRRLRDPGNVFLDG